MSKLIRLPDREASLRVLRICSRVLSVIFLTLRDSLAVLGVLFIGYAREQGCAWSPIIFIIMVVCTLSLVIRVSFAHKL
jgi:hypothetical protein